MASATIASHSAEIAYSKLESEVNAMTALPLALDQMSGTWIKDYQRSDPMDGACEVLQVGGIVAQAARLMKGIELKLTDSAFYFTMISHLPFVKATETYCLSGKRSAHRRRDMRKGQHQGWVQLCSGSGSITLQMEWQEPLAGCAVDVFRLVDPCTLHIVTTLSCGGRMVQYTTVYSRRK